MRVVGYGLVQRDNGRTLLELSYGPQAILAALVFLACLLGIHTRPVGFLAMIWPANALMLGFLLRVPKAANALGWAGAAVAYLAADLLTGSSLFKAVLLNVANLAGVYVAYLIYARLPADARALRQPSSLGYLVLAAAAAGVAAGVVGGLSNPLLFSGSFAKGWALWFATEFVNYVTLLPVILVAPSIHGIGRERRATPLGAFDLAPMAALILSCAAAVVVGGPGAMSFPVPALLWCSLAYPVFPTALLTLFFGLWTLVFISTGRAAGPPGDYAEMTLVSIRIGISLVALAPLMLAIVTQSRNALLSRLEALASLDQLTGVYNRRAFRETGQELLDSASSSMAAMMLDIDHFKRINDDFGHAAGDEVLAIFAKRVTNCLRPSDLFGRLGGEEFATLIPDCCEADAASISERIRRTIAGPLTLADGRTINATVSIGLVVVSGHRARHLDGVLAEADLLLYRAKHNGRDRVEKAVIDEE